MEPLRIMLGEKILYLAGEKFKPGHPIAIKQLWLKELFAAQASKKKV
jgi:hypothetical protein